MKRPYALPILLCGLTALPLWTLAGSPAFRHDDDPNAQYTNSVDLLKQVAGHDDTMKKYSPSVQAMLKHAILKDMEPTPSERKVAKIFNGDQQTDPNSQPQKGKTKNDHTQLFKRGFGGGLTYVATQFKKTLPTLPGIGAKPTFKSAMRKMPLSTQQTGVINVFINTSSNTIVDLPVGSGRMTVAQRIQAVKAKLEQTAQADPLFWTQLSVGHVNGLCVVSTPNAPGGYIITCDPRFAHQRGYGTPEQLAAALITDIRTTFDPLPKMAQRALPTPDERHRMAVQLCEQGTAAYTQGDTATAIDDCNKAIELDPAFVMPYKLLAGIYIEQNKPDDARDQINKALGQQINADDEQELRELLEKTNH